MNVPTIEMPEALLAATEALEQREAAVRAAEAAVAAAREAVTDAHRRDIATVAAAREAGKRDPKPEHEQEALAALAAAEHEAEIAGARRDQVAAEYSRTAVEERPRWRERVEREWRKLDATQVRLPREEREEINPPSAEHVEAVYERLPERHRLALLFLDWSGARVSAIDLTLVGDYDEPRQRVRLRSATTKTRRPLWIDLPPPLAEAIEATLPHRRFRDPEARLFAESGADALRTSIVKACKAAGVPLWSPHDLRHRRISLLHLRGVPWARIAEFVGQRSLSVTADTYTHVLLDDRELDHTGLARYLDA